MNNEKTIVLLFFLILNISFPNFALSLSQNTSSDSLDSLKETIIALDVTRTKSEQTVRQLKQMQKMSLRKDLKDYTIFIEYLSYQIINYCHQINAQYGSQAITDLPCELQQNYFQNDQREIMAKEVKTSEEQVSSLDNELMNSLGDFDEMLLKEEAQLAQVSRKQTASSSSNQGKSSPAKDDLSDNKPESKASQEQSDKNKQTKDNTTGKGKQKTYAKNNAKERRRLEEIDDDIVARQLKEAAEKESDPQLKEKLWVEYYRYKKKTAKK